MPDAHTPTTPRTRTATRKARRKKTRTPTSATPASRTTSSSRSRTRSSRTSLWLSWPQRQTWVTPRLRRNSARACTTSCLRSTPGKARSMGVAVENRIHSYRPRSELSIDDRKKNVEKAKQNSHCRACGAKGHWAIYPVCPSRTTKGAGEGGKGGHKSVKFQVGPPTNRGRPTGMTAVLEKT
eukprot:3788074-Heterocapsa_arctica.AAC.1